MDNEKVDWQSFLEWEREACSKVEPQDSMPRLMSELFAEWELKLHKSEHAKCV